MKSFLAAARDRIRLVVHIDKNAAEHPFRDDFSRVATHFVYTEVSGRPTPRSLIYGPLKKHLKDCDFYVCGPGEWQTRMRNALQVSGAAGVYGEHFGPELQ